MLGAGQQPGGAPDGLPGDATRLLRWRVAEAGRAVPGDLRCPPGRTGGRAGGNADAGGVVEGPRVAAQGQAADLLAGQVAGDLQRPGLLRCESEPPFVGEQERGRVHESDADSDPHG